MARISKHLIRKSGWPPCTRCGTPQEEGQSCEQCTAEAHDLIDRALNQQPFVTNART